MDTVLYNETKGFVKGIDLDDKLEFTDNLQDACIHDHLESESISDTFSYEELEVVPVYTHPNGTISTTVGTPIEEVDGYIVN